GSVPGEVRCVGGAPRSGNVARARVDGLRLAAVALGGAGVEHEVRAVGPRHLVLPDDGAGAQPRLAAGGRYRPDPAADRPTSARRDAGAGARPRPGAGGRYRRDRGGERSTLGEPAAEAAVEDGHVVVPVGAKHVPEPRRRRPRLVVVGHDLRAGADPLLPHHAAHLLLGWPWMTAHRPPAAAPGGGEVALDVEEDGALDVARVVGRAGAPAGA